MQNDTTWRETVGAILRPLVLQGLTKSQLAQELNARRIRSPRGLEWTETNIAPYLPDLSKAEQKVRRAAIHQSKSDAFGQKRQAQIEKLTPVFAALIEQGMTNAQIAAELDRRGLSTTHGAKWNANSVSRYMAPDLREPPRKGPANPETGDGLCQLTPEQAYAEWFKAVEAIARPLLDRKAKPRALAAHLNAHGSTGPKGGLWTSKSVRLHFSQHFEPVDPDADAERYEELGQTIQALWDQGLSLSKIAGELNGRGIPALQGGRWGVMNVRVFLPDISEEDRKSRHAAARQARALATKERTEAKRREIEPVLLTLIAQGLSAKEIAEELNSRKIPGLDGAAWTRNSIYPHIVRTNELRSAHISQ